MLIFKRLTRLRSWNTFNRYGELDSQIHLFRPLAASALLIQKQQNTYLDTAYLPWKFPLQIWLKKDIKDHTLLFINIPWSTFYIFLGVPSLLIVVGSWGKTETREPFYKIPLYQIPSLTTEFINLTHIYSTIPSPPILLYVKWFSPIDPFVKLNVDGFFLPHTQQGGARGVFHNSKEKWILVFLWFQLSLKQSCRIPGTQKEVRNSF